MMLIDKIKEKCTEHSNSEYLKKINECVVFKVQNVADYLFQGSDKEVWTFKDFPNCAPPAPEMWMEWHNHNWTRSEGKIIKLSDITKTWAPITFAVFIHSQETESMKKLLSLKHIVPDYVKWISTATIYVSVMDKIVSIGGVTWFVDKEGCITPIKSSRGDELLFATNRKMQGQELTDHCEQIKVGMFVPWLAMSFMHCKNVEVVSNGHAQKLQASRLKKSKLPLTSFKTLVIEQMKKIISSSGEDNGGLSPKALHICRGHFKDFNEKGLFGKYKGRYWWPMHSKGNAVNGVINKDYEVKS